MEHRYVSTTGGKRRELITEKPIVVSVRRNEGTESDTGAQLDVAGM